VEAHHLPAPELEADIREQLAAGEATHLQRHGARLDMVVVALIAEGAADHQLGDRVLVGLRRA
jgi:hypothetical protein